MVCAGRSASVVEAVKVNGLPSPTDLLPMAVSTGARFTSVMTMVMVSEAVSAPSLTRTVSMLVLGPCASVGVQVNTPFAGSMAAPEGAFERL